MSRWCTVADQLLEVRGVAMHFPLRRTTTDWMKRERPELLRAVDGVDLDVRKGEMLGLVGESGCGKSTLGRCIVGLYSPSGGEIRYAGEQLSAKLNMPVDLLRASLRRSLLEIEGCFRT